MLDHVRMYTDSDYAEEFKEENGRYPTTEEVTNMLYEQNGDGCDLIYWIRNLTTGEMIFNGAVEESDPEEWDDDIDEMLTESSDKFIELSKLPGNKQEEYIVDAIHAILPDLEKEVIESETRELFTKLIDKYPRKDIAADPDFSGNVAPQDASTREKLKTAFTGLNI